MKSTTLFLLLSFSSATLAAENVFCGTQNQWNEGTKSGWFFELDFANKNADVTKAENTQTVRHYSYALETANNSIELTSSYGDTIQFIANKAHYKNEKENLTEDFEVNCFPAKAVSSIRFNKVNIEKTSSLYSSVKGLKKNFFEVTTSEIPFPLLAQKLQYTISQIGDWEDTILTPAQSVKVLKALESNADFQKMLSSVKISEWKQVGTLFGRDWYAGAGTVAFVLQKNNQLIVLPFDFEGGVKFDDERLDYVY